MQLSIVSWNSITDINDGTHFSSTFPPGQLVNLTANGVTVPRAAAFPFLSTSVLTSHVIVIRVVILPGNVIPTYRELLKAIFNVQDTQKHTLVAKDILDSDRQWYLSGLPVRVVEQSAGLYSVTLQLDTPVWQLVTPTDDAWSITASGQTDTVAVIGNIPAKPVFEITPTVTKTGGLSYRRWTPVYNQMDISFIEPFDITDGGLNTAALIAGGKMQADGDDFRVWVDGSEVDRWLDAINTTNTRCWINLTLSPKKEATTSVTVSNVGSPTTLSFVRNKNSLAFLQAMARALNKVVLIDSEAFLFTGVNFSTYQLTGVSRAQKGTSAATHTAPATARWIEHDIWIYYGDAALSAPEVDSDMQPMWDLDSDNALLSFSQYADSSVARPGAWQSEILATRSAVSYPFTGNEGTLGTNPATELGLAIRNSADVLVLQQEQAVLDWIYTHPSGITNVAYQGKSYTQNGSWPAVMGLQILIPDTVWRTVQNEVVPGASTVWTSFGSRSVALGATYKSIRFVIDGSVALLAADAAMIQFDTVVLTIDSSNVPVVTVGSEQSINFFDITLTNTTTGEFLTCYTPCPVNSTLTIDCERKLVYLSNGERASVGFSSEREAWLDLEVGNNVLQYDDTGTNAVTVHTIHRDRTM